MDDFWNTGLSIFAVCASMAGMLGLSRSPVEFRLLLLLLREGLGTATAEETAAFVAARRIDWEEFLRVLQDHRLIQPVRLALEGLAAQGLMPGEALERYKGLFKREKFQQMQRVADLLELARAFDRAGIRYIALKGPVLGQLIHGDPTARHCKDLDILVAWEECERAETVLRDLGYAREVDVLQDCSLGGAERCQFGHHAVFLKESGRAVELHWRLSSSMQAYLPSEFDEIYQGSVLVAVGGASVRSLSDSLLQLYLLLHGSNHAWFRLKWLHDLLLLGRLGESSPVPLLASPSIQSLLEWRDFLVSELFRLRPPAFVPGGFNRCVLLARISLSLQVGHARRPEGFAWLLKSFLATVVSFEGWSPRMAYVLNLFDGSRIRSRFPVSRRWRWIYLIIGPPYVLGRRLKGSLFRP